MPNWPRFSEAFAETGIVKLSDVFSADDAARMREVVWRDLFHTDGVQQDDPSTWQRKTPLRKLARAKRDPIFQAMFGERLRSLADSLLGKGWELRRDEPAARATRVRAIWRHASRRRRHAARRR